MKFVAGLSAAIVLVAQPAGDIDSQARIAGYLKGMVPGTGRIDVVRARKPIPTKRGMPLLDGDQIIITGDAKIYIMSNVPQLNGNRDSSFSPITFPVRPPPPQGVWGAVTRLLAALSIPTSVIERPPASAAQSPTKGVADCPPSTRYSGKLEPVPALHSKVQHLPGAGPLTLAWVGGKSPYTVEVKAGIGWTRLSQTQK